MKHDRDQMAVIRKIIITIGIIAALVAMIVTYTIRMGHVVNFQQSRPGKPKVKGKVMRASYLNRYIVCMSSSHQSDHEQVIKKFYTAFAQKDYATMQSLYHEQATFSDPVFQNLNAQEVRAMWQMLLTSARDLTVSFTNVKASEKEATCQWDAHYTFTRTGRKVHNIIIASFQFLDGKILVHRDHFEFRRWSRQAFGLTGALLGGTSFFQNKIRKTARAGLDKFMQRDAR